MRWLLLVASIHVYASREPPDLRRGEATELTTLAEVRADGRPVAHGRTHTARAPRRHAQPRESQRSAASRGPGALRRQEAPGPQRLGGALEAARRAVEATDLRRSAWTPNATSVAIRRGRRAAKREDPTTTTTTTGPSPDETVDERVEKEQKPPAPSRTKREAAERLAASKAEKEKSGNATHSKERPSEMKWIREHLRMLKVQFVDDVLTAEGKKSATVNEMGKELAMRLSAKYVVHNQYLQSLNYDVEIAPAAATFNGNSFDLDSRTADQVGLTDNSTGSSTTTTAPPAPTTAPATAVVAQRTPQVLHVKRRARKLGQRKVRRLGNASAPAFSLLEAQMVQFAQTYHTRQHGKLVKLRDGKMHRLVEGDMLLAPGVTYDWNLWSFGDVPYVMHRSVDKCATDTFKAAVFEIEKHTCVRFKESTEDTGIEIWENKSSPMLFVTAENSGCFGGIGYKEITKEHNVLNIGSGCSFPGIILHTLLHNLGVAHEQARYDRDLFVNILWDNMVSEEEFKEQSEGDLTGVFRILKDTNSSWEATNQWLEYDYGSVMHFGKCEFSQAPAEGSEDCEASMKAIIDGGEDLMGNRFALTAKDITVLNTMYGCTATCSDGVQNQEETDVDCGGPNCAACGTPSFEKMPVDCPLASAWNRKGDKAMDPIQGSVAGRVALFVLVFAAS